MGTIFLLILILALDFFISWGNANYVGRYWSESKVIGGSFRVYVISGYVMAIAGFTMVYGYILLLIAPYILELANVKPELISDIQQLSSDFMYLIIIISIIPTGFFIWLKSMQNFWKKRNLTNGLTAAWNTYAQINNIASAAKEMPSLLGRIGKGLFKGKGKKKANEFVIICAIFICICAIFGGYCTAEYIMKKADRERLANEQYNRDGYNESV